MENYFFTLCVITTVVLALGFSTVRYETLNTYLMYALVVLMIVALQTMFLILIWS